MKRAALAAMMAVGTLVLVHSQADAASCVSGVYRAGCAGPNGAVAVRKPAYRPAAVYHSPAVVHCANGVYRAGCVGPNGAAVVRRPY